MFSALISLDLVGFSVMLKLLCFSFLDLASVVFSIFEIGSSGSHGTLLMQFALFQVSFLKRQRASGITL